MPTTFCILLIEDDPQTAQMVRFYLERENFTVIVAKDGLAGEAAFRQRASQLVLLDIMLPGIDGLELCRRIRRQSAVPILMLTARTEDTDKAIGLGIGADDYLTKPFSPIELIARVKALLRRAYQYNDPPQPAFLGGAHLSRRLAQPRCSSCFYGGNFSVGVVWRAVGYRPGFRFGGGDGLFARPRCSGK